MSDIPIGTVPVRAVSVARDRGTLVSAALGVLVVQITMAIPAVLNGLFQQDLGTSSSELTWITAAFLIPVTLLELSFGVFGDLVGRKRLMVGGAALMVVGLVVMVLTPGPGAGTSERVTILVIGQVVTGIGAAAVLPSSLAMVTHSTSTVQHRSRALAIWSASLMLGAVISPVLGGWAAGHSYRGDALGGWHWAFLVCIALSLVSVAVTALCADESAAPEGRSLDWPGQVTVALFLFSLLFAVIQGPTSGWGSAEVVAGFVLAVAFFVAFLVVERRVAAPLLHLDLFRIRPFAVAAAATVLGMFAYLGSGYSASIRLSAIQGFSPLRTSIAFVLMYLFAVPLTPVVSRVLARVNPRFVMAGAFVLIAIGDIWVSRVPIENESYRPLIAPLLIIGLGLPFAVASVTAVTVNSVAKNLAGMASGLSSMLRDLGFTLAPVVLGAIALSRAAGDISAKVASDPALQKALDAFNASPDNAPAAQKASLEAAVGAVHSGPLGANAVPGQLPDGTPFNPLKDVAFTALGHAYSLSWLICGLAAVAAALLVAVALHGKADDNKISEESLAGRV